MRSSKRSKKDTLRFSTPTSFEEHGQALQERTPHPGYIPADKLTRILQMIKQMLQSEEDE
jgi:hypothetical protein